MKTRHRGGVLERDFHVLFGEQARWKWPFIKDGLIGAILSLGIYTFLASIVINIFIHIHLDRAGFIVLAGVVFLWEVLSNNWACIRDSSLRNKLRKKYMPIVENTEAYELLEEAVAARKKGVVEGMGDKAETEAGLIRLWKAAFAEADSLSAPQSPIGRLVDPLDAEPIGNHINRYFEERATSYQEINA